MLAFFTRIPHLLWAGATYLFAAKRRRVTAIATSAILIIAAILWIIHTRQVAREAVQEAELAQAQVGVLVDARAADAASLGTREASQAAARNKEEIDRAKTEAALRAHPSWADERVPAAVLDSLR